MASHDLTHYHAVMLTLLTVLTACTTTPESDTTDSGSRAECPYDAASDMCLRDMSEPGPSWHERLEAGLQSGLCTPYTVCPTGAHATHAVIDFYYEYADSHYFAADGTHVASVFGTDEVNSDIPCECDQRGMEVWVGPPQMDCPTWNAETYALPSCPLRQPLNDQGNLDRVGTLTGADSWEDTLAFQASSCAGIATCGDGLRALLRLDVNEPIEVRGATYGIDVFASDGALVGTADVTTLQSWGTVPEGCLMPTSVSAGCTE